MKIKSTYLNSVITPEWIGKTADKLVELITESGIEFDTIAFRGASGSLISPFVAFRMNKQILLVRKNDGSHSSHKLEGNIEAKRYIIIDDLIASGNTIKTIVRLVKQHQYFYQIFRTNTHEEAVELTGKCVGVFLYHEDRKLYEEQYNTMEFKYGIFKSNPYRDDMENEMPTENDPHFSFDEKIKIHGFRFEHPID